MKLSAVTHAALAVPASSLASGARREDTLVCVWTQDASSGRPTCNWVKGTSLATRVSATLH